MAFVCESLPFLGIVGGLRSKTFREAEGKPQNQAGKCIFHAINPFIIYSVSLKHFHGFERCRGYIFGKTGFKLRGSGLVSARFKSFACGEVALLAVGI